MAGKVKSIDKTQKASEQSAPTPAFARLGATISANTFADNMIPQLVGNLAVQRLFEAGVIKAKLAISNPGDPYEQEADQVADQVMRMAEPTVQMKPG